MIRHFRRKQKKAFTLIELLVVIAIIALLAAILVPAVQNALFRGTVTQTTSNGRAIYLSTFAKSLDNIVIQDAGQIGWPKARENTPNANTPAFNNSTEFFTFLVTNGVMNVPFSFFSARGIPPSRGSDPDDFTADNNAWTMVAGLFDSANDGIPFLFSRNLEIDNLLEPTSLRDAIPADSQPFGRNAIVVVTKGGSAFTLQDEQITYDNFNAAGDNAPGLENLVILTPD